MFNNKHQIKVKETAFAFICIVVGSTSSIAKMALRAQFYPQFNSLERISPGQFEIILN